MSVYKKGGENPEDKDFNMMDHPIIMAVKATNDLPKKACG